MLGRKPTDHIGHPIRPAFAASTTPAFARKLVNAVVPKPTNLSPEPGAMLRGQLSPINKIRNSVRAMGTSRGKIRLTKKIGGTIVREVPLFVMASPYRT